MTNTIYLIFAENGNIRKWSHQPFEIDGTPATAWHPAPAAQQDETAAALPPPTSFGQGMAKAIDVIFNGTATGHDRKYGYALFWFEFNKLENGRVNYVSNASRDDMITACKEWTARAEGRLQESGAIQ